MATIKQVAEQARVSVATVSRVVNNSGYVSADLKARVENAMYALDYKPSALARGLRSQKTHTIGVLVPHLNQPFFSTLSFALERTLFAGDYRTLICGSEDDPVKEAAYIDILLRQRVDGVILVPLGQNADGASRLIAASIPVVLIDRDLPRLSISRVLSDNFGGGYTGARHLLDLGHRQIALAGGHISSVTTQARAEGAQKAFREFDLPTVDNLHEFDASTEFEAGYTTGRRLLTTPQPPSAIFALTDVVAVGVLHAASELGLALPGDLSVMGYDDIPLAAYFIPELTTIAQPIYAMGQTAVEILLRRLHDPGGAPETITLETRLVLRKSTAPPKFLIRHLLKDAEAMPLLLGIDIGTSSVKAILFDPDSVAVLAAAGREYPIHKPAPDRAEQDPDDWWNATVDCVQRATAQAGRRDVAAIGLCGQMHGFAMLDAKHQSIHPAVVWPDQRSAAECAELVGLLGAERFTAIAGTMPATGFMAPTLLWMKRHDSALLDQIRSVVLPKDYVRLKMTGAVATDPSDAAATACFDVSARTWSDEIINGAGLPRAIFPPVLDSAAVAGTLTEAAAQALGLAAGIPVVAGCADQPAQAIGNGMIAPGKAAIAIGSGGQVVTPLIPKGTAIPTDPRLHVFNHAIPGMWYILGAILAAGLSLRWLRHAVGMDDLGKAAYERFSAEAATVRPGADGLIFLPYLSGERTPHMDPKARGGFIGLNYHHEQGHLARAVMEGVAFALRECLELSIGLGGAVEGVIATGGGVESGVWRQILADVLGLPLQKSLMSEQAGVGAALLAGVGTGMYKSFEEAGGLTQHYGDPTEPVAERRALYDALYAEYQALYPRLREDFHTLSEI